MNRRRRRSVYPSNDAPRARGATSLKWTSGDVVYVLGSSTSGRQAVEGTSISMSAVQVAVERLPLTLTLTLAPAQVPVEGTRSSMSAVQVAVERLPLTLTLTLTLALTLALALALAPTLTGEVR